MLIMARWAAAGLVPGSGRCCASWPLEEISNTLLGRRARRLTFVVYGAIIVLIARFQPGGILTLIKRLWARRGKTPEANGRGGSNPCSLKPAMLTKAFGSFKAVDAASVDAGAGRHPRPDSAERGRQIHAVQLPAGDSCLSDLRQSFVSKVRTSPI